MVIHGVMRFIWKLEVLTCQAYDPAEIIGLCIYIYGFRKFIQIQKLNSPCMFLYSSIVLHAHSTSLVNIAPPWEIDTEAKLGVISINRRECFFFPIFFGNFNTSIQLASNLIHVNSFLNQMYIDNYLIQVSISCLFHLPGCSAITAALTLSLLVLKLGEMSPL